MCLVWILLLASVLDSYQENLMFLTLSLRVASGYMWPLWV